ncbi:MAG: hypothetical protein E7G06_11220, partial [Bifidobacterium longum]|nr:hypothetical protein [Bifidobacterium longum]
SNCSTPRDNLNNRQRDHGRPLKPQVLQPPLESAYLLSCCNIRLFLVQNSFSSLILILSMIFRNSQQ